MQDAFGLDECGADECGFIGILQEWIGILVLLWINL